MQGPKVAGQASQKPALVAALGQTLKRFGFCNCCKKFRELHHCLGPWPLFATWGGNSMFGQGLQMGDETLGGRKAKNACKGAPGAGLLAAHSRICGTWPPTSPPRVRLCRSWPGRAPRKGRKTQTLARVMQGFAPEPGFSHFEPGFKMTPAAGGGFPGACGCSPGSGLTGQLVWACFGGSHPVVLPEFCLEQSFEA